MQQENAIENQAFDWVAKEGSLSPEEQAGLESWLNENPRHVGAYSRAMCIYRYAAGDLRSEQHGPYLQHEDTLPEISSQDSSLEPTGRRMFMKAAAAIGFTVAVGGSLLLARPGSAKAQAYSTKKGEVKFITLEDGSTFCLNTLTTIETYFSSDQRLVRLRRGEVFLDVPKSGDLPFSAQAGRFMLQTGGGRFTLTDLDRTGATLVVQEGVANAIVSGGAPIRVGSDTKVYLDDKGQPHFEKLTADEVAQRLLWQKGLVSFSDTRLADAAKTFARYSDTELLLGNSSIGDLQVTGVYSAGDPVGFAKTVGELFELKVQYGNRKVMLR